MTIATNPPIEIPLERLTGPQKWELFQTLWEQLSEGQERDESSPEWHGEVLRERLDREARGEAVWHDVDESFDRIRQQIAHGR
jgi:hypothetical protein